MASFASKRVDTSIDMVSDQDVARQFMRFAQIETVPFMCLTKPIFSISDINFPISVRN